MSDRRGRGGRGRGDDFRPNGGKDSVEGVGYWDEREAAQAEAAFRAAFEHRPHNLEAEAALLGALMIDNRLVEIIAPTLKPDHFFELSHGRIYERIATLVGRGKLATPITLLPYFEGETFTFDSHGNAEPVTKYLASLTGSGAGLIGASQFAEQIIDLALHREIILAAKRIADVAKATDAAVDPRAVLQLADTEFYELSTSIQVDRSTTSTFAQAVDQVTREMDDMASGKPIDGILIDGYDDWNQTVGRMAGGDMILLAGRPGMGKTGVACAVAVGAASAGHAVDYFTLEMKRERLARRMLANMIFEPGKTSGYTELSQGRARRADHAAIAAARTAIDSYPLGLHDPASMLAEELLPWIMRRKRHWQKQGKELKLVIGENLDLLGTARNYQNPADRLSHISRSVKQAAMAAKIPILALTHINRGVEAREDKRPVLPDLRQSGSLEQDADIVAFVYRDEYYLVRSEPKKGTDKWNAWADEMTASRDRLELYTAKVREGAPTKRTGYFFAEHQAVRSSDFYSTDMFNTGPGFRMGDADAGGFGEG